MPINLVPQSTDVAGGGNAQLLKALKERKAMQEMLAGQAGKSGQAQAPAFAPSNAGQAAFGYAGVAANALGDRMVMEREKADQAKRLQAGAEALKATVPQFKDMPTATIMGLMLSDPELPSKLAIKQHEVTNRAPQDFRGGLYRPGQGWEVAPEPKTSERDPQKTYVREPAATGGAPILGPQMQPGAMQAPAPREEIIQQGRLDSSKMRDHITTLPSYKAIAASRPVFNSMTDAIKTDDRASDIPLIYGLAKIMDPTSVVRESEMTIAQAISSFPQQLRATIESNLASTGRLPADVRQGILRVAHDRMRAYENEYENETKQYRDIAARNNIPPEDIAVTFDRTQPPEQQATHMPTPQPQLDPALMQEAIRRGLIPGPQAP